jgi:outer membrane lipoprotein SlyB
MRTLGLAAFLALALSAPATTAEACTPFGEPELARLMAASLAGGLDVEVVEGAALKSFLAQLAEHVSLGDVVEPVKLVIVFGDEAARIAVIAEAGLCNVISGPASGVRAMLKAARGEPA